MGSKTSALATRAYVDASIDAQRQHTAKLFQDAEQRMGYFLAAHVAEQNRQLEAKLQEALGTIRPAPTVYPPQPSSGWTQLTITRQDGRLKLSLR